MVEPENTPVIRITPFIFTGNSVDFFKIWIVNLFLMILTLGLYSPWAKVRKLRYLYGNIFVDDNRFDYLADPIRILKGRLVAVIALVFYYLAWDFYPDAGMFLLIVGVLLAPLALITATSFQMRNTSYRNIRFSFQAEYKALYRQLIIPLGIVLSLTGAMYFVFNPDWIPFYGKDTNESELVKSDFLSLFFFLALMPAIPYLDFLRSSFIVNHTQYGNLDAEFEGDTWGFYKLYLLTCLIFISIIIFEGLIVTGTIYALRYSFELEFINLFTDQLFGLTLIIIFYLLNFIAVAFLKVKRTNFIYEQTSFGAYSNRIRIYSRLKTWHLSWIYISNTLLIVISLGMLIPWAKIRSSRYFASCVELESRGLDNVKARSDDDQSALGDELLNIFDMDLGI